jgi:hypothetical protein
MPITYHDRIPVKRLAKDRLHDLGFRLETMAGSIENSRDPIHMDDIGLERLRQPFPLRSVDPYDSAYTPTKTSSYQVTEREAEVNRGTFEQDRFLLLHKHRLLHNWSGNNETANQNHIHWLYPILMAMSFLAGLILAVGHHIYYSWLEGQPVGSVARQQWSLRLVTKNACCPSDLSSHQYWQRLCHCGQLSSENRCRHRIYPVFMEDPEK